MLFRILHYFLNRNFSIIINSGSMVTQQVHKLSDCSIKTENEYKMVIIKAIFPPIVVGMICCQINTSK